jgi:glycosyltransferase involved in cell wall biosynthesis
MTFKHRLTFITIVPSPYQRDLFEAISRRNDVDLRVYYMEPSSPDSPWPKVSLRPFEHMLSGFWIPFGGARWHFNWGLPKFAKSEIVVLSSFTSLTGQWLMRKRLRRSRWLFWGERLRVQNRRFRGAIQRILTSPMQKATAIVAIGREAENDYRTRFPATPRFCIPYYCDLTEFFKVSRNRGSGEPITFFFCGQMIRRKGVDLLLIAFDRLIAKGISARLLLVGREADLPEFLETVRPETRALIRYEGFQAPERLPEYFAQCDVFVLPSRHDGWGVVVNQALGAGLPVITSDAVGAGLDLVEEHVNGLRFAAGDVDGLEACMQTIAAAPDTAREWGEASRRKARQITPEAGAQEWVRVLDLLYKQQPVEVDSQ